MISTKNRRKGFTLIEMSIASVMMAFVASFGMLGWNSLGRATVDLIVRAQLTQEMDFVAASLSRDLGGCVVDKTPAEQIFTAFPIAGSKFIAPSDTTESSNIQWRLDNNDTITYQLDTSNSDLWKHNNLIRIYHDILKDTYTTFTVARNVDSFHASWSSDGNKLTIRVDFSCNYRPSDPAASEARTHSIIKRTCVFVTNMPSPKLLP